MGSFSHAADVSFTTSVRYIEWKKKKKSSHHYKLICLPWLCCMVKLPAGEFILFIFILWSKKVMSPHQWTWDWIIWPVCKIPLSSTRTSISNILVEIKMRQTISLGGIRCLFSDFLFPEFLFTVRYWAQIEQSFIFCLLFQFSFPALNSILRLQGLLCWYWVWGFELDGYRSHTAPLQLELMEALQVLLGPTLKL